MNPLTDDSRSEHRRSDSSGFVTHDATTGAGDDALAAVAAALSQNRKHSLRRQALLDIQTRGDRPELIVERNFQQAASDGRTPRLLAVRIVGAHRQTARRNSRNDFP